MEKKTLEAIALGILILLAGCGGIGSGGSNTPDATPTATPNTPQSPTQTPPPTSESQYPDGWSATGVENATMAINTHYRSVLTGPSATVEYRSREQVENGTGNSTTLQMAYDTGEKQLYAVIAGKTTQQEFYFADGTFTQWDSQNETARSQSGVRFAQVAQSVDQRVLFSQLLTYQLEHNRTVERNGTTAFVYNVTGVPDKTYSNTYGLAESSSGYIVVAESGRVLELQTTVTYANGTLTYSYAHTQLGETTVTTPTWAPQ